MFLFCSLPRHREQPGDLTCERNSARLLWHQSACPAAEAGREHRHEHTALCHRTLCAVAPLSWSLEKLHRESRHDGEHTCTEMQSHRNGTCALLLPFFKKQEKEISVTDGQSSAIYIFM